jgi:YVTN family beta-propeller protein
MKPVLRKTIAQGGLIVILGIVGICLFIALHRFHKPFRLALVNTIKVEQEPLGLTLSPDFSSLYVANAQSGTISQIDTKSQRVVKTFAVNPSGRLNSVISSPDGTTLYTTDAKSGNVEVLSLPEGEKIFTIPVRLFPQRMAFSKDNIRLYVVNSASNNVSVIDTTTHTLLTNIPVNERPYAIAIAPDNKFAYVTSSQTHSITIIDLESQNPVETIVLEAISRLTNAAMSPDGKYLYICDSMSNSIVVVDTTTKTQVQTLNVAKFDKHDLEFSPTDLTLSNNGKLLYVVGRAGYLSVINLADGTVLVSLEVGKDLRNIALTSDGTAYISSFGTNSVSVVQ